MPYQYSYEHPFTTAGSNTGMATAIAVEQAAGAITGGVWDVAVAMEVVRVQVLVTVAFDYNVQVTEGRVAFYKRVTYGSDTGRVLLGTVRLIDGTPAGARLFVDIQAHKCLPGQQVVAEISVTAVGGTELGDFLPEFVAMMVPEMYTAAKNAAGVAMLINAKV